MGHLIPILSLRKKYEELVKVFVATIATFDCNRRDYCARNQRSWENRTKKAGGTVMTNLSYPPDMDPRQGTNPDQAEPDAIAPSDDERLRETKTDLMDDSPELQAVRSPADPRGVHQSKGVGRFLSWLQDLSSMEKAPTGGDMDVDQYLARVVGEEAVGGTAPTPDQNVVEDLAISAGVQTPDRVPLHTSEMLEERDSHRWELDPESSEDYEEHQR
jgi:hypothetical protein